MRGYPRWFEPAVIATMGLVFTTGMLLLPGFLHVRLEWDAPWRLSSGGRIGTAASHLLGGCVALLSLGALWSVHIRGQWRQSAGRLTGLLAATALLFLAVSGAGIYYLGGERWSLVASVTHVLAGVSFGVAFGWHVVSRRRARLLRGMFVALAAAPAAKSQEGLEQEAAMPMPTVTVAAPSSWERAGPPGFQLDGAALDDRQPQLLADALRGIPGVSVSPNSRGETVVRLRGSEERQAAVFLDGSPLNVPWDGRVDLGALPAGAISAVSITKGTAPVEYGPNAAAGVVEFETVRPNEGVDAGWRAGSGHFSAVDVAGTWLPTDRGIAGLHATLAASRVARDFVVVADPAALPFSQESGEARTNTDLAIGSLFAAAGVERDAARWRFSLWRADARRGIAPEAHLDPASSSPRYWRYPSWTLTHVNLMAERFLPRDVTVRSVLWRQWFAQDIDAFLTDRFDGLRARERGRDDAFGMRLIAAHPLGAADLRWSASAQRGTHDQTEHSLPGGTPHSLRYRQDLRSVGLEASWPRAGEMRWSLGGALEFADTPLTGDKPAQRAQRREALTAALAWEISQSWTLTGSVGRRARFPTLRESYGEALGRFLVSPDLRPERVEGVDLGLAWHAGSARVAFNPYFQRYRDTLSQRVVEVSGQFLRQRFNLPGHAASGVDIEVSARMPRGFGLEFGGNWLRTRVDVSPEFPFRSLPQRPAYEMFAAMERSFAGRAQLRVELRRVGGAFDIGENGAAVGLRGGTELALRTAIPLKRLRNGGTLEGVFAVDNPTNRVIEPQLGLPLPGRTLSMGVRLRGG